MDNYGTCSTFKNKIICEITQNVNEIALNGLSLSETLFMFSVCVYLCNHDIHIFENVNVWNQIFYTEYKIFNQIWKLFAVNLKTNIKSCTLQLKDEFIENLMRYENSNEVSFTAHVWRFKKNTLYFVI